LCDVFYRTGVHAPVLIAPKASLGEAFDASGLLQIAIGASALRSGLSPMIAGLAEPRVSGPRYATRSVPVERGALLVSASSRNGSHAAWVLSGGA
jgi:3-oxoacyl-(acyl-carrier-protein) synthase